MARASRSSLKAIRSSSEPPPRTSSTTSAPRTPWARSRARTRVSTAPVPLHGRRGEHQVHAGGAPPHHGQHVAERRPAARGDHHHPAGQQRQGPLAGLVEEPLGRERPAALLHRQGQGPDPRRFHAVGVELVAALGVVDLDPAVDDDGHPVVGPEGDLGPLRPPDHAAQRGAGVLEREVEMPRGGHREVADLTLDQDVLQVGAARDDAADERGQLGHGQRPAQAHRRPSRDAALSGSRRGEGGRLMGRTYDRSKPRCPGARTWITPARGRSGRARR